MPSSTLLYLLERAQYVGHLTSWRYDRSRVYMHTSFGHYHMTPEHASTYLRGVLHYERVAPRL